MSGIPGIDTGGGGIEVGGGTNGDFGGGKSGIFKGGFVFSPVGTSSGGSMNYLAIGGMLLVAFFIYKKVK